MMLTNKNILLISPEPWSSMYVSKHHYASQLALKGNKVFFLNPPSRQFSKLQITNNLWSIEYKPSIRGLFKFPKWINSFFIKKELIRIEKLIGINFDVIWNFDPSRFFNLSKIEILKICHIVDWNQKFQRKTLSFTSDICFSTSSYLKEELDKFNSKSYLINHGYNPGEILPVDIPSGNGKMKIGYMGNLNIKYLDWKTIFKVVRTHFNTNFYFFGPYNLETGTEEMKSVKKLKNSYFLGEIDSNLIPSYLEKMDILLLVYLADEHPIQLSNPHKLLEYLASGKPIVSTNTSYYRNNGELVFMSKKNKEFPDLFSHVLTKYNNYNSVDLIQKRKSFALENTYEKQIEKIERLISQLK